MKESSTIKHVRWLFGDPTILTVEFNNGGIYEYKGVPEHLYLNFIKAESLGKFFHERIRHEFAFIKLENE